MVCDASSEEGFAGDKHAAAQLVVFIDVSGSGSNVLPVPARGSLGEGATAHPCAGTHRLTEPNGNEGAQRKAGDKSPAGGER